MQSNKMKDMSITKLLFQMSIPAMFSMLIQSLYNIIDTIYIANYSPDKGVEALAIAYPFQMIILAVFLGISVGSNAQIAKKLGAQKIDEASDTAKNGLFLTLIMSLVFVVIGFTVPRAFISLFSKDIEIIDMGTTYLTIVTTACIGMGFQIMFEKILQATSNMKAAMISQLIGAIINIVLDPLLIFNAHLGIMGAALATIIGQFVGMFYALLQFIIKKQDVSINMLKNFKPSFTVDKKIFRVGIPTMFMNSLNSITITAMNGILGSFPNGIRLLGIYFKLQSFVFMPVFGLMQGALPILSYNFGYRNKERYQETRRLSNFTSIAIMTVGLLIFQLIPGIFLDMFQVTGEAKELGIICLRVISLSFIPAALNITATTSFQSIGSGFMGLIMSFSRQLVILLPTAFILAKLTNMNYTWLCYPISEIVTTLIFIPLSYKIIHNKFIKVGMN